MVEIYFFKKLSKIYEIPESESNFNMTANFWSDTALFLCSPIFLFSNASLTFQLYEYEKEYI